MFCKSNFRLSYLSVLRSLREAENTPCQTAYCIDTSSELNLEGLPLYSVYAYVQLLLF
jgi:hypothetical protein